MSTRQVAEATAREHKSHQADMELEASLQALRQESSHDTATAAAADGRAGARHSATPDSIIRR